MLSFSSLEPLEPERLAAARQLGLGGLGELDVAVEVAACACPSSWPLSESRSIAYSRIVSSMRNRGSPSALSRLADEAVVDERGDAVEHLAELEPERLAGDGLGGLERGAADEDAEAREERLAEVVEQVVAPLDRVLERVLAAAAAREERQALLAEARRRSAPASSA